MILPTIRITGPTKIADINNDRRGKSDSVPEGTSWFKGVICHYATMMGGSSHSFLVEFADAGDEGTYARPIGPYEISEFEQIFDFGGHCHGFTTERIILIRGKKPE